MSDIFDDYAKIAIEQGLIKEASEVGDETNQRFDSLSDDDIRSLYGVKPNGEEEHILDQAHPESAYVAPAYDKMNGLVENLFERQDIMAWIATKPNDGKHTNERYVKASQDLTMALLNTAFLLDRTGNEELMKLADSCAKRLSDSHEPKLKKEAIEPLTIGIIVAVSLLATTAVASQHLTVTQGIIPASVLAIEKLSDLLEDSPQLVKEFGKLRLAIIKLHSVAKRVESLDLTKPNKKPTAEEAEAVAKKMYGQNAFAILEYYGRVVNVLVEALPKYIGLLAQKDKEMGGWGRAEWLRKSLRFLYMTDVPDAIKSLEDLLDSLMEGQGGISARQALLKEFAADKDGVLGKLEKAKKGLDVDKEQKPNAVDSLEGLLAEEGVA